MVLMSMFKFESIFAVIAFFVGVVVYGLSFFFGEAVALGLGM